jgi:arylformamidase
VAISVVRVGVAAVAVFAFGVQAPAASGGWRPQPARVAGGARGEPAPIGGVHVIHDVAYGADPLQRFDVYLPPQAAAAPVIVMVHGGAWEFGDKDSRGVVEAKVARWVPRGFVFISVDYRLVPAATPLEQAHDVVRALAVAQRSAAKWGADPRRFILMGHSAGAHLVALVTASAALRSDAAPWLGSVLLDSAALDVPRIMEARHLRMYDRAFGHDPASWVAVSPWHALSGGSPPVLAVCSTRRLDSCSQADAFAARAARFGSHVSVLREDLSHLEINSLLGEGTAYTRAVEDFLRGLDPEVARRLR